MYKNNPSTPEAPSNPSDNIGGEGNRSKNPPGSYDEATNTLTLTRKTGDNFKLNSEIGSEDEPLTIVLKNLIGTQKEYKYTVTRCEGFTSGIVYFEITENGRFYIAGDGIKVVAEDGQDDDIILIGNNNHLKTGSGCDIVRVGFAIDSPEFCVQSDNNIINTGDGDDYVINYGINKIDMGNGNKDKVTVFSGGDNDNISNQEIVLNFSGRSNTSDGKIDGGYQSGYGDCKFLSLITTLNLKGSLGDYISIKPLGANEYEVSFKRSGTSQKVNLNADLNDKNVTGDLDFAIIEAAFRKLIEAEGYNMDENSSDPEHSLGDSDNNFLISKFVFGVDSKSPSCYAWSPEYEEFCKIILGKFLSGDINNLILGSQDKNSQGNENLSLGIFCNHAYAVIGGKVGEYIEVVNPWDSNDKIRLDWDDMFKYFESVNVFGDALTFIENNFIVGNSAPIYNDNYLNNNAEDNVNEIDLVQAQIDAILEDELKKKGTLELYS